MMMIISIKFSHKNDKHFCLCVHVFLFFFFSFFLFVCFCFFFVFTCNLILKLPVRLKLSMILKFINFTFAKEVLSEMLKPSLKTFNINVRIKSCMILLLFTWEPDALVVVCGTTNL